MSAPSLLVLAAGMGSRYGGIKQLDPVGSAGEVILHYSIYDALRAGFGKVVFIIRHGIESDFRTAVLDRLPSDIPVEIAYQELDSVPGTTVPVGRKKPWGTAHAVLCAREALDSPFAVINADDYYGVDVYNDVAGFLRQVDQGSTDFAMAGYRLENTLSEHGSVSRGVCEVNGDGYLESIEEHVRIEREGRRIISRRPDAEPVELAADSTVSMNFFCLTPAVFGYLDAAFRTFLSNRDDPSTGEIYLPGAIGEMVAEGTCSVKVLPTESEWFGVTYQEDKPRVVDQFRLLSRQKVYPSPLWKQGRS
jgi:NDP-sugar pyrophosphorylase family protein